MKIHISSGEESGGCFLPQVRSESWFSPGWLFPHPHCNTNREEGREAFHTILGLVDMVESEELHPSPLQKYLGD